MSFDICLKRAEASDPVTIGYNEFKAMIQRGELGPKCLVRDPILTGNDWWPLDELNVFHTHSPTPHPAGARLQKKLDAARHWNERTQLSWAQYEEYLSGDLIERSFQLVPLPELVGSTNSHGATRLHVIRSFEPERIFTFLFQSDVIQIDVCQGGTSLWSSLPQVSSTNGVMEERSGSPFIGAQVYRASAKLPYKQAPEPFRQWSSLVSASQLAPSCLSLMSDGVSFKHRILLPTGCFTVKWGNPCKGEHAPQIELLESYYRCIVAVGLERFWRGRSPEAPEAKGGNAGQREPYW